MAEDVPCYTDDRWYAGSGLLHRSESEKDMRRLDDVLCCCACISNCPKDVSGHIRKTGRILSSTVWYENASGSVILHGTSQEDKVAVLRNGRNDPSCYVLFTRAENFNRSWMICQNMY